MDHDDEIEWIDDGGGGNIHLVKSGSFAVGSKVCIRAEKPTFGWGLARSWSVGTVRSFRGGQYIVDFPEVKGWKCKENDLAISPGLDRSTKDIGTEDPAFDKFGFVCNKDGGSFEFTGNGEMEVPRKRPVGSWIRAWKAETYSDKPLL